MKDAKSEANQTEGIDSSQASKAILQDREHLVVSSKVKSVTSNRAFVSSLHKGEATTSEVDRGVSRSAELKRREHQKGAIK